MSGSRSCHSANSEAVGAHSVDELEGNPAIAGQVMGEGAATGQVVSVERLYADAYF